MKVVGKLLLVTYVVVNAGCLPERPISTELARADSVEIVQTVLNDPKLVEDAKQSFDRQPLKIVRYRIIQENYDLTFADQTVEIVPEDYLDKISESASKYMVVTVPMLQAVNTDTVRLSMVVYPGQATFIYTLVKHRDSWQIKGRESGKL